MEIYTQINKTYILWNIKKSEEKREDLPSPFSPVVNVHTLGVVIQMYASVGGKQMSEKMWGCEVCVCIGGARMKTGGRCVCVCVQYTEVEVPSQLAAVNSTHTHSWLETHWVWGCTHAQAHNAQRYARRCIPHRKQTHSKNILVLTQASDVRSNIHIT